MPGPATVTMCGSMDPTGYTYLHKNWWDRGSTSIQEQRMPQLRHIIASGDAWDSHMRISMADSSLFLCPIKDAPRFSSAFMRFHLAQTSVQQSQAALRFR